jgi:hypothetical protein
MTGETRQVLRILQNLPGYPFDRVKDLAQVQELVRDYPEVDMLLEVKKFRDYYTERKFGPKEKPRARLRTWMDHAEKWRVERALQLANAPPGQARARDAPFDVQAYVAGLGPEGDPLGLHEGEILREVTT